MPKQYQLAAQERSVRALDEALIEEMWSIFERYYDDVDRASFERDLREKDGVLLLLDRERLTLAGFSTIQSYARTVGGRRVVVVFSGDTVCEERYWGQRALHSAFLRYIIRVKLANPLTPVYWFLMSKGYKTYLLLAHNFPEFWPRDGRRTPEWQRQILDALAQEKYGSAWLPDRGVLHFASPQGKLRAGVAPIGLAERADDHVRFFGDMNPHAADGDELCCIGRIDAALALNYLRRRLLRRFRGRAQDTRPKKDAIMQRTIQ